MQQQLFLHIGDCKTGSTVIQSMLAGQHCVPQGLRLHYTSQSSHAGLARSLGDRQELYPARWQGVARRLARADWDVSVLSSELFEFIHPDRVAQALQDHLPDHADSVKVIVYIRPHAARVLSQFAENLKLGHHTGTMEPFVERFLATGRQNFSKRLERWKAQFGDRLIVRPFVRDQLVAGDVRRDFLSLVLGDTPYTLSGGQDKNASLGLGDLALMRLLQRRFGAAQGIKLDNRVAFGKQFGRMLHANAPVHPSEKLRLPRDLYDRISTAAMADAKRMDAIWVANPCFVSALNSAADNVIETAQSLEAQEYHSPETIRQAQIWADLTILQMAGNPKDFARRLRPMAAHKPVP